MSLKVLVSADLDVQALKYVDVAVTFINSLIERSVKEMLDTDLSQASVGTVVSTAQPCEPTKDKTMFTVVVPWCYILNTTITTTAVDDEISQVVQYQIVTRLRREVSSSKYNNNFVASHTVAWQSPRLVACPLGWTLSGVQFDMPQEVEQGFQQASWMFLLDAMSPESSVDRVIVTSQGIVTGDALTVYGVVLGESDNIDAFDNAVVQSYHGTPGVFLDQWNTASSGGSNSGISSLPYVSSVVDMKVFFPGDPAAVLPVPWKQNVLQRKPVEYKERHWINTSHVAMVLGALAVTILGMGGGLVILQTRKRRPVVPVLPALNV